MKILITISLLLMMSLMSCIEIFDDIYIKNDGSGTFKYKINLSASKVKVNSILALDSLDGKKVPSIPEIKEKINKYKLQLEQKEGISNVKIESNFTDFILKFQCDFNNVALLQKALKELIIDESKGRTAKDFEGTWLQWEANKLVRSVPTLATDFTSKLKKEDAEALKKGNYISITRFDRAIEKSDNPLSVLSANKMAVMVKTTPYALIQNLQLLENTVYITDQKIIK